MDQQRLDTRPKAAWVSGLREPDAASPAAKKRQRPAQPQKQQLTESAPPPQPPQQLRSFADLGPAERQRLAELVSELGHLAEAKARAEKGLAEERQLRRREVDSLRADLERQRRTLAELEARLAADTERRRGPRSVASQCDESTKPSPSPPPPKQAPPVSSGGRRRAFTERIDREIGAAPSGAKPQPGEDDDAILALLRQQLRLTDRTQRHLCRQLRELSGVSAKKLPDNEGPRDRGAAAAGGRSGGNRILRQPHADSADEFFVLPEVLGPPQPPARSRIRRTPVRPPPPRSPSPRPDSLLDIVESLDGPQFDDEEEEIDGEAFGGFGDADEGEGDESGDDDSGVLEDLFFLS